MIVCYLFGCIPGNKSFDATHLHVINGDSGTNVGHLTLLIKSRMFHNYLVKIPGISHISRI